MIREVGVGAGDGVASGGILGLKIGAVSGEDELRLGLGGGGAGFEAYKGLGHLPFGAGLEVDVVRLKNAIKVGFVRRSCAQAFDGSVLIPESQEEGIGELVSIERLLGQDGDGLFNFNSVHWRAFSDRKYVWDLQMWKTR